MKARTKIYVAVGISAIPAILVASTAVYALIYDNSQGEAFDTATGIYRYDYLLEIFCITFGVVFALILALIGAIWFGIFLFDKLNLLIDSKRPKI